MINLKEPEFVLICAFRYALGRRSYAVGMIVDEIMSNWDELGDSIKKLIQDEIKDADSLGMECDKEQWNRILKL